MVGVSPLQKAQRAFVTVLLRLAAKYCLQLGVTRDSSAKELTAAFRKVARRTHPDKGGTTADTQALNAAREAWVAQTSLLRRPGPKAVAPSTALVVLEGWSANFPGKSLFRVRSVAVLLTYCTFLANNWLHFVGYVQSVRTDLFDEAVRTRTDVKEGRPYAIAVQEA